MASTAAEWVCATVFCVYILSFTTEFRDIEMRYPKVCYKPGRISTSKEVLNGSNDSTIAGPTARTIT